MNTLNIHLHMGQSSLKIYLRLVAKLLGKGGYNKYPQRLTSKRSNQDRTCTPRREHRRGGGLQRPQRYETRNQLQELKWGQGGE